MTSVKCRVAAFGSPLHAAAVELRRRELRLPLRLDFTAEELAEEEDDLHIVGEEEGALVACLVLTPAGVDTVKLRQMAVEPSRRGRGFGSKLVAFAEREAAALGAERIVLHAREHAVEFYERLGYAIEGEPFVEVTIPHRRMSKRLA